MDDIGTTLSFEEFARADIRVGTVLEAQPFPGARKPDLKLRVDFGAGIGVKPSSAQITALYDPVALVCRQVLAVVNLAPRRIGPFVSEVLVLGVNDAQGRVVLLRPDVPVPDGERMH